MYTEENAQAEWRDTWVKNGSICLESTEVSQCTDQIPGNGHYKLK